MNKEGYWRRLKEIARDTAKFSNIKGTMIGRVLLGTLSHDIFIQYEIKHVFMVRSTFSKCTEMDEVYRKVIKLVIPDEQC